MRVTSRGSPVLRSSPPLFTVPDLHRWTRYPANYSRSIRQVYKERDTWGWPYLGPLRAWNGAALDTLRLRLLVPRGGGHNDHGNNDTQGLDLTQGEWDLPYLDGTDPLEAGEFDVGNGQTSRIPRTSSQPSIHTYSDGKPGSRHTGFGVRYVPAIDRVLSYGGCSYGTTPNMDQSLWLLDPAKLPTAATTPVWTPGPNGPLPPAYGASAIWPRTGEVLYIEPGGGLSAYEPRLARWRVLEGRVPPGDWSMAFALLGDLGLWIGVGYAYAIDLASGVPVARDLTAELPAELVARGSSGLEALPTAGSFLAWNSGPVVYEITPSRSGPWTTKTHALEGEDPGPVPSLPTYQQGIQGVYGRFFIIPPGAVPSVTDGSVVVGLVMHADKFFLGRLMPGAGGEAVIPPPNPPETGYTETVIEVPLIRQTLPVAEAPVKYVGAVYDVGNQSLSRVESPTFTREYVFTDAALGRKPKTGDYFKTWQEQTGGTLVGSVGRVDLIVDPGDPVEPEPEPEPPGPEPPQEVEVEMTSPTLVLTVRRQ